YVWVVLANLGVPEAQLDDAHQEVFVTCYRRRSSYRRDRPIKPWLVGIARRIAFRYRRSEQRAQRKYSEFTREGDERQSPRRQVEARILLEQVLERLEPTRREVLILSELEGRTGPEIAAELGIHLDAAYSRLRSARKALTRVFTSIEEEPRPPEQARRSFAALLPQLYDPSTTLIGSVLAAKAKVAAGVAMAVLMSATIVTLVVNDDKSFAAADRMRAAPESEAARASKSIEVVEADGDQTPAIAPRSASGSQKPTNSNLARAATKPHAKPFAGKHKTATEARHPATHETNEAVPETEAPASPTSAEQAGAETGESPSTLGEEARLLAEAKKALNGGAPGEALLPLAEHGRRFATGSLADAREGLRIEALCALGRGREARGAAASLRRTHPDSSFSWLLADPCPSSDEPPG
ncbi:MAG: sigma-70 family RNA polymerase sigma factor, partial [Nannocystaceae bacterium]